MQGWLIVNRFLHTDKFSEHTKWLLRAAEEKGILLSCKTNAEVAVMVCEDGIVLAMKEELPDFVLFWDKDIRLAKALEAMGIRLYNQAEAIYACDDKYETFYRLAKAGKFPLPKTIPAPMTYDNIGYNNVEFLDTVIEKLGFPLVVKECFGSFGWQVYLASGKTELLAIVEKIGTKPMIFQEYIEASKGKDLRLQVVGDEVVCAMMRQSSTDDFRANLTLGGSMQAYTPSREECELAVSVTKTLGLDFAGVDLLMDGKKRYVCEVNSNAHFKTIADCTGVDVAACMLSYIIGLGCQKPSHFGGQVNGGKDVSGNPNI